MQKTAPSPARLGAMVVFALSCFGLLLFLWLSFGGPVPLKPKGYRLQVAFPEAATLGVEADVRVAGVSVGRVVRKELGGQPDARDARARPPLRAAQGDARAMLREKTLLGETYVELTPGKRRAVGARERPAGRRAGGERGRSSTRSSARSTRARGRRSAAGSRTWRRGSARTGATSTTPSARCPASPPTPPTWSPCSTPSGGRSALLIRNTGQVFGALSHDQQRLRDLVTSSGRLFDATSDQAGRPGRGDLDLPDLPRRVQGDLRAAEDVLDGHGPVDPRPAARRPRPRADAARRAGVRPRSAPHLRRSAAADPRLAHRAAGAARTLLALEPALGRARPVPRASSTRSSSTSSCISSRSPTSSPTAPPRVADTTTSNDPEATSATTCARSGRRAPRRRSSGSRA